VVDITQSTGTGSQAQRLRYKAGQLTVAFGPRVAIRGLWPDDRAAVVLRGLCSVDDRGFEFGGQRQLTPGGDVAGRNHG